MFQVSKVLLFVHLTILTVDSANILALAPYSGRSHFIVMEPWLEALAARGHQVTVFSPFPKKSPPPNYTDVDVSRNLTRTTFSLDTIIGKMSNPFQTIHFMEEAFLSTCHLLREPPFQEILKNKNRYDLVVTELFGTDCMTYFAYKLNIPLISYTTTIALPWSSERFGIPDNPSYIPNFLLIHTPEMSLLQRTYNTLVVLYGKFWHEWVFPKQHQRIAEEAFGEPLPPISEVVANTSLLLVNSFHSLTWSRPFPPNVIEVGGMHIRESKPLPEDLKTILDEAKNGVLVVSFGSTVQMTSLPNSLVKMLMEVFSEIPQTVIVKYDGDLPNPPKNVIIKEWLPQRDMIEHENVVALFGHGGLASTIETVYFNKPFIGIPFFGDQFLNIKYITERDAGIQLNFEDLTKEKVATAVREITTNPKYKEGMRRLSQQYRDRPMTALQSAVYWTEYVIRHQGAPHLRPASVSLPLYQYLLLDIIALLFVTLVVIMASVVFMAKKLLASISNGQRPLVRRIKHD